MGEHRLDLSCHLKEPERTKDLNKVYETIIFNSVGTRQQRTVILVRCETNEVNPLIAQLNAFREFQICNAGKEN